MRAAESILSTIVLLPQFTVADLVSACDLPPQTIRSVLRRNEEWFEEVGRTDTGKAGGRWKQYRATAAAQVALTLERDMQAGVRAVPPGLMAVEELLLPSGVGGLPRVTVESLLRRARRFRDEVPSAVSQDPWTRLHLRAADALLALTEAEISGDRVAATRLRESTFEWRSLANAVDDVLMAALDERFASSPICGPSEMTVVNGTERSAVAGPASRVLAELVDLVSSLVSSDALAPQSVTASAWRASRPTGADIAARARRRVVYLCPPELPGFAGAPSRTGLVARGATLTFLGFGHGGSEVSVWPTMRSPAFGPDLARDNQLLGWQSTVGDVDSRGLV